MGTSLPRLSDRGIAASLGASRLYGVLAAGRAGVQIDR